MGARAFWGGEFANSFVLAKMKIFTKGRHLWTRTIGSTIAGEIVDSMIFYPLAFLGAEGWTTERVIQVTLFNYTAKVLVEIVATPLTYRVVNFLKRVEKEDYYDRNTNFNPFTLEGFTRLVPNSHILFGSDYLGNAGSAGNVVRGLESYTGFTPAQLRAVERENALALFPRLKQA